jgi:hypothetical protein
MPRLYGISNDNANPCTRNLSAGSYDSRSDFIDFPAARRAAHIDNVAALSSQKLPGSGALAGADDPDPCGRTQHSIRDLFPETAPEIRRVQLPNAYHSAVPGNSVGQSPVLTRWCQKTSRERRSFVEHLMSSTSLCCRFVVFCRRSITAGLQCREISMARKRGVPVTGTPSGTSARSMDTGAH